MPGDLPSAVLFACTQNVIRSVMAGAIMKHFYGHKVYVASCGVRPGQADPFVAAAMDEMGIDLGKQRPQSFADLEDSSFDVVISLSPEAHHRALEMTRTMAIEAEYWPTLDPSVTAEAANRYWTATAPCAINWCGRSGRGSEVSGRVVSNFFPSPLAGEGGAKRRMRGPSSSPPVMTGRSPGHLLAFLRKVTALTT